MLGVAEAYFRGRLNQHWFTDILGGFVVGWAFLAAVAATVRVFDPSPRTAAPALDADPDAARARRLPWGPTRPAEAAPAQRSTVRPRPPVPATARR